MLIGYLLSVWHDLCYVLAHGNDKRIWIILWDGYFILLTEKFMKVKLEVDSVAYREDSKRGGREGLIVAP